MNTFRIWLFLMAATLGSLVGVAQAPQGTNDEKQAVQNNSIRLNDAGKQNNRDKQDAQNKQKNGEKQDKKGGSKTKSTSSTITITVLSDQQIPIKDAVVVLYTSNSEERQATGTDGTVTFQVREGTLTLRVTADHMEPYQKPLNPPGDQKDVVIRVVLKKSN